MHPRYRRGRDRWACPPCSVGRRDAGRRLVRARRDLGLDGRCVRGDLRDEPALGRRNRAVRAPIVRGFFIAFQFLTRLPSPIRGQVALEEMGRSMRWFPVVGALIGLLVAAVDFLLSQITTPEIRAVSAVALLAALTGGLHLDGLMDSCDGLFAFTTPQRRLEIMGDSRVGSFAIAGVATMLLMKFAAILSLPPELRVVGFISMGALSRWAMVYATVRYPPARSSGLAHDFKISAGRVDVAIATATAVLVALTAGPAGLGAALLTFAVTVGVARYAIAKLDGLTGDVYGAIAEVVEVSVTVALPPLARLILV
ncbi:MAG: adenosylcobinamide-GDP ribazoletransferase [Chloroflexi bacterium]|nr:adenosylcobinamide-GDP ribazoletransferase [Chloroflexota bacterium]